MSIRRVVPNIASDKPGASRDFYAGLLGFQVTMDMGWILTFVSPSNPTAQVSVLRQDASAQSSPSLPSRSPTSTPFMPRLCGVALSWCIRRPRSLGGCGASSSRTPTGWC
jgi:hypothetical protein